MIAGVKFRAIPAETGTWSLSGKIVREAIEKAKEEGFRPFFLTATVGTTATCAVDDLEGIAEVGKDHPEIWLHVDAAVKPLNLLELLCWMLTVVRWSSTDLPGVSSLDQSGGELRLIRHEYA